MSGSVVRELDAGGGTSTVAAAVFITRRSGGMDSMRVLGEGRGREGGEDSQPTHRYIEHNWRDSPVRRYTLNSSPRTRSSSPSSATTPSPSHPHWIPAPLVSKVSEWSVIRVVRSGRVVGFG